MKTLLVLTLFLATSAIAAEPPIAVEACTCLPADYSRLSTLYHGMPVPLVRSVEVCHSCRPQPPGTWQPIFYPTPLRNWLFGAARWQPDPNYRWQPGQWVPIQPHPKQGAPQWHQK